MIETADTDYVADYDTDYERPIMSLYFDRKSEKNTILRQKCSDDRFLVLDHK